MRGSGQQDRDDGAFIADSKSECGLLFLILPEAEPIGTPIWQADRNCLMRAGAPGYTLTGELRSKRMSIQPKRNCRFEDYLATERESVDAKHEYVAGQVFAMAGASYNHNHATLIAEVLSPSHRGLRPRRQVRHLPRPGEPAPVCQYVLIAQNRLAVDVFTRQKNGGWLLDAYTDPAAPIDFAAIDSTLTLGEVYDKVEFEAHAGEAATRPD